MYIREVKTKGKGKEYIAHRLVEAYKNKDGNPRQRVIMYLGNIDLPKNRWKELALLLEQRVTGQTTFHSVTTELNIVADDLYARGRFAESREEAREQAKEERDIVKVDLNSVQTSESRSLGPELVADDMWMRLGFNEILNDCRMSDKQHAVAKALIIGRLINPGSELETWRWFNNRTALSEMTDKDIKGIGKDIFYETADVLYEQRDIIECELYNRETRLFSLKRRCFLFDLTNTYFEGTAAQNGIAQYGKSKEKRTDCPLVALALMVDENGFPVYSRVYEGNTSEPGTLKEVIEDLKQKNKVFALGQKPIMIMDRGIATKKNLAFLQEDGYDYVVIERSPVEKEYKAEYAQLKSLLGEHASAQALQEAGWMQISDRTEVYVQKKLNEDTARVLALSVKREEKELSISRLRRERFLEDIERLRQSVEAGHIVIPFKVGERIGRLKQKYIGIGALYDIEIVCDEEKPERAKSIKYEKKHQGEQQSTLAGCYVIETNKVQMDAEDIWHVYMTLTRVEAAFRDLKSELGLRPIYHRKEERTKSHLFIGVLAYHLLVSIENKMRSAGDSREWQTIKRILSTHQRTTVILTGEDKTVYQIRVSGRPEAEQHQIYKKLGVADRLKKQKTVIH